MERRLSAGRFRHVLGVAETADALARRHGVDVQKAWLAGILHDYARELPLEETRRLAERYGLLAVAAEPTVALLHAPLGAVLLREEQGVTDQDVLQAVARHTTGSPGMTPLDKVVYLADFIEPGRAFPGVAEVRALAWQALTWQDLDGAVQEAMVRGIRFVESRGGKVDRRTLEGLASLRQERGG